MGCLVLQPDGKLVAAGRTGVSVNGSMAEDFALVRYYSDGTLDPTFGAVAKSRPISRAGLNLRTRSCASRTASS